MKIIIVSPYDLGASGGVQQVCLELAERLRSGGDEVVVAGPGQAPGTTSLGGSVVLRANRSRMPIGLGPASSSRLRHVSSGVDVIHVHEPFIPLAGWAALRERTAKVATFHADPAPWTRKAYSWGAAVGRRMLGDARLSAVSVVARSALPASWGDVELIPNAIDVSAYEPAVPRNRQRVLFLGRDDPRKGLGVLLEAWPAVRRAVPGAELVVVGAERKDAPEGVVYRGRVEESEKRRLLASSQVYVAPNLGGESFGVVVAEGMAAGCAVVASSLEAFRAVLGSDGVLVTPGDPVDLSRAVTGLLQHPQRASALGSAARRSASRFDWPRVVDRYRSVYESAISTHRSTINRQKE